MQSPSVWLHSPRSCCHDHELRGDGRGSCRFDGLPDFRPKTCLQRCSGSAPTCPKQRQQQRLAPPSCSLLHKEYILHFGTIKVNSRYFPLVVLRRHQRQRTQSGFIASRRYGSVAWMLYRKRYTVTSGRYETALRSLSLLAAADGRAAERWASAERAHFLRRRSSRPAPSAAPCLLVV